MSNVRKPNQTVTDENGNLSAHVHKLGHAESMIMALALDFYAANGPDNRHDEAARQLANLFAGDTLNTVTVDFPEL